MHLEDIQLSGMIDDIAQTVDPLIQKNQNQLEIRCDEEVGVMHADLTRVRQVFFNLLSNAAKFTEQGTITLSVERRLEETDEYVVFRVADSGIGMNREQLDRIFEPFKQADSSTTRKYGDTGLGLTICREFCQIMGGQITAESREGVASTFVVHLPARVEAAVSLDVEDRPDFAPVSPTTSPPVDPDAPTVLVIDDDPYARDILERSLSSEGYRVLTDASGEEGLALAKQHHPHRITLDVMMPSMDGWTVLSRLKEDAALSAIPVVMNTLVEDEDLGCALGASDYLIKPVEEKTLLQTVGKWVSSSKPGTVLLVEDFAETREMVARMLSRGGLTVIEAENGAVALDLLQHNQPDLILLDLMMPVMDGVEFVEAVEGDEALRTIPIIVLTAKEITQEDRDQLNGRVSQILLKGELNKNELLQRVRGLARTSIRD